MIRAAFVIFHILIGCSILLVGQGGLMWIFDALLVTYPFYYLLVTVVWGTLATWLLLKIERRARDRKQAIKTWLLMMLSIHWVSVVLLLADTFSIFREI